MKRITFFISFAFCVISCASTTWYNQSHPPDFDDWGKALKLIEEGKIGVDACNSQGFTLLGAISTISGGETKSIYPHVKQLLQLGAKPDAINKLNGTIPLNSAIFNGWQSSVLLMINNIENVDIKNSDGSTALMYSSKNGWSDVVEVLLMKGANINELNKKNQNALIFAAKAYGVKSNVVHLLLKYGAKKSHADIYGKTALDYALERYDHDKSKKNVVGLLTN